MFLKLAELEHFVRGMKADKASTAAAAVLFAEARHNCGMVLAGKSGIVVRMNTVMHRLRDR